MPISVATNVSLNIIPSKPIPTANSRFSTPLPSPSFFIYFFYLYYPTPPPAISPVAVTNHLMACGKLTTHFSPHLISSRTNRSPFSVRISGRINGFLARADRSLIADAPSCIFVGPIETASKETLEALYRQVIIVFVIIISHMHCLYMS